MVNSSMGMIGDFSNRSVVDVNKTLENFNDEEALRRLAPMIYLGLLMLVGVPGNLLVLIVYSNKFPRNTHRAFIVGLGMADILACIITLPFEIIEMRFQYMFYNSWICKFFRSCNNLFALSSIFILMGLSADRYRRVCKPLKLQMTTCHAKLFILGSACLALFFSWPNFIIAGIRLVYLGPFNVTGYDCSLSDQYARTKFPTIYGGVLFLIFIICIVSLIVIYSLIGHRVLGHIQFRRKFSSVSSSNTTSTNVDDNKGQGEMKEDVFEDENRRRSKKKLLSKKSKSKKSRHLPTNSSKNDAAASHRLTKISFAISLAFILSYLPHLIISLLTAIKGKFLFPPGPVVSAVLPIVTRSFAINNIVNPIIYGFMDRRFRNGIKVMFNNKLCCK